jgi:DNA primase
MLTEKYTLSSIWNTRGSYVETEDMKLKELVPETVLSFKSDKIKILQKEIIKEISQAKGDDERIAILQERYKVMTSLQKKIAYSLGKRVV